jgi:hypothetical protein
MKRSQERSAKDMTKSATPRSRTKPAKAAPSPADLDDRIKHLECYIASASAANRTHRAMMVDYVPAEETRRTRAKSSRRPMHTMQLARRRSAALFMQVIILGIMIAAAVGWMNQKFHFWN